MKKDRTLKYIILIFAMIMSFFMFSNNKANALEYTDDYGVTIELVDTSDGQGYIISGATSSEIVNDWVMPSEYNSKPIVSIADGSEISVINSIANILTGKVTIGSNIQEIGDYAFRAFNRVNEIIVPSSVITIGTDAFLECDNLEIIRINRIEISGENRYTVIKENGLGGLNTEKIKIVFNNSSYKTNYENGAGWNENLVKRFTYDIKFSLNGVFPNGVEVPSHEVNGFFGFAVGNTMFDEYGNIRDEYNLQFNGFNFDGWYDGDERLTSLSIMNWNKNIYPQWSLKEFENSQISTYYIDENGQMVKYSDGDVNVNYGDIDDGLIIKLDYAHELTDGVVTVTLSKKYGSRYNDIDSSNAYVVKNVADSGSYKSKIVVSYVGKDGSNNDKTYEISDIKDISINIAKRNLLINVNSNETEYGTYVGPKLVDEKYYSIDETSSLAKNDNIDDTTIVLSEQFDDEYKNVGFYSNSLKLEITNIVNGEESVYNNYNIIYTYGNLRVVAKSESINLLVDKEIEYGDNDSITRTVSYTIYGVSETVTYTFSRENTTSKNVGEYEIVGVSANNSNYNVSLDNSTHRYLIINPKKVTVIWDVASDLVYDGTVKSVSAKYVDNDGNDQNLNVLVLKNNTEAEFKNAGNYKLIANMINNDDNYSLHYEKSINKSIDKANTIISGSERQTKIYNRYNQYVDVTINHNEAIAEKKYSQRDECKNATTNSAPCIVEVSVPETENYKSATKNFYLYISAYTLQVEPNQFTVTYGTGISLNDVSMIVEGVNGENVLVYFAVANNTTTRDVGYYDIVGVSYTNSTNYRAIMVDGSGANKLYVAPMPLTVEFYYYTNLVYDGNIKNIGIRIFGTEVDKETIGLQVNYGDKVIKNAGDYRIDVTLTNNNYAITNKSYIEFTIAKANYNVQDLKLESKKVNFGFGAYFINLQGNLPDGLTAEYTIDGHKGNGTRLPFKHKVKVTFIGDFENYNYIEPMEATLNISITWIWVTLLSVVGTVGAIILVLYLLIKNNKLVIIKRISKKRIRRVIRKNRELDNINKLIKENVSKVSKEEEPSRIEESIKFVKNPVYVLDAENAVSMSFVDKLFKSEYGTKQFYSEVKNELLSYEGIVSKIKRDYETFYLNNIPVAKFDIVDGELVVYFALDPNQYKKEEYNHEDVSSQKVFAPVPLKLTVNSIESLRHAKMFVRIIRKRERIKSVSNFVRTDYVSVYTAKEGTFKLFRKTMARKDEEIED